MDFTKAKIGSLLLKLMLDSQTLIELFLFGFIKIMLMSLGFCIGLGLVIVRVEKKYNFVLSTFWKKS